MKDIYEVTKKVKVIGTLDENNDGEKFIRVEIKDCEPQIIMFDELIDSLMGQQIKIETSLEIE